MADDGIPLAPPPWHTERVYRLERIRFLIAASMLGTMVAETVLLFALNWYDLWLWLGLIAVQGYALHVAGKMVARERALAVEKWVAQMRAASSRFVEKRS